MNTSANSPHSPQRLALDLQRARDELELERQRTHQLLDEIDRQNAELDRLRSSVHREANSRLLAEEALDESRERLQLAVEAAGLALWDWHLKSPQIFMTARWGEMIGDVAIDGYWAYDTLMDRIHPDDRSRIEAASKKLAEVRSTKLVNEYRVRSGDDWIWVESHGMVAEHDSQGRPLRLMGTLADISERKRIEADMQRARDQAEQANRAKTEFLANTSHEIRTPLNALMGLTQLLMDSPVNAEQRSWLELMDSSAHTLLNMLNDVLDLSRIEAGKMDVERVRYELPRTLQEVGALYENQARARSVQWTLAVAGDLPQWVVGDPGRLRQVLGNLLSNALKFTPKGGRIRLSASSQADVRGGKTLRLQVQDSGVGIAPKHQARIFEAFTQADSSTARRYGGSGLGLTICARLVRLMGGRIDLESELGMGSTFTVTLPLEEDGRDTQDLPTDQVHEDVDAIRGAGRRFADIRVLVAEDNPVNELLMNQWLQRLGCVVHNARDGAEAVSQWEAQPVDVVLMDVQMPRVSGMDATERIRAREAATGRGRTPIIAVTANAMDGDRQACLSAGMDGYLSKPVSPSALVLAMEAVLPSIRARQPAPPPASTNIPARPGPMDLDKLLRRLDHNQETLTQLAAAMRTDLSQRLGALRTALSDRNRDVAVAHAHGLAGSLGSMTAERGARLAKGLELAARSEDWQLFARALPLLESEAVAIDDALLQVVRPTTRAGD